MPKSWRCHAKNAIYPQAFLKKRSGYCNRLHPSVRPLCYLLLNPWTKFNQIWCVSYWHKLGVQRQTLFFAPPPGALGRGQKVKYHLISITKSISKIFIPNFVCVLTNEKYKTYQTGFSFCPLGHAPGVGLWGAGVPSGSKKKIFKHGHAVYQIDGSDKQNRMQVKFHPRVKLVTFGVRSKVKYHYTIDAFFWG